MRRNLEATTPMPIAVIGMSLRVPGATTLERYWRNIVEGRDCLTRLSASELRRAGVPQEALAHPDFVRALPALDDVERFDADFFGMSGREAELTDPSHRLFLECAWESLESAGIVPGRRGPVTGVFGGCEGNYQQKVLKSIDDPRRYPGVSLPIRLGNSIDFLTTRVSHRLDLTGPSCAVMAACATSLMAVDLAVQSLRRGECEVALAGGATVLLPRVGGYVAGVEGMFSPTGRLRPFDAAADGTIFGSGVGVVALRPLADALAAGNPIHAIVLGTGSSNDGHPPGKESFIAPSPEGQIAAIEAALADARVSPETIGYVEAHGTGTRLGDPVEVAALSQVYRRAVQRARGCALGSVKANVGHLRSAAGVASLIKACLALERRTLPPLANFERPNPRIDFDSGPFTVPTTARAWEAGGSPRRAAVSSFGFGGSNVHVVLEEHREAAARPSRRRAHLLFASARTPASLARQVEELAAHLDAHPALPAADVAHTLLHGRAPFAHRACFLAQGPAIGDSARVLSRPLATGVAPDESAEPVFLFPGQGAAIHGAGRALYENEPVYRDAVDECANALGGPLGYDLRELLGYVAAPAGRAASQDALRMTALAQPALFTVEVAAARLFLSWGVRPAAMLGHSLGELSAACVAGVFTLPDALAVVAARGRLMQSCEPGAMAAVFLAEEELVSRLPPDVEIAAVNAPAVVVVSGSTAAIAGFCETLAAAGIGSQRLDTAHAFHSRMMDPALAEFERIVAGVSLSAPSIPVVSNATGLPLTAAQATSPRYWADHIRRPVRWSAGVHHMLARTRPVFVELGPGSAMGELVRRHESGARVFPAMPAVRSGDGGSDDARTALAGLWCAGAELAPPAGDERRDLVRLPTTPFERVRHWVDDEHAPPPDPSRVLYERGLRPEPLPAGAASVADRPWIVFGDEDPFADALVARLAASGAAVVRAIDGAAFEPGERGRFRIRADARDDWAAVLAAAAALGCARAPCVLHLGSVGGASVLHNTAESFDDASVAGFHSLVALAQAVFERGEAAGIEVLVVTDGLARVDGETGDRHAEKAAVLGAARVIPKEIPGLSMRVVDVPGEAAAAAQPFVVDALLAEACATRDLSPVPAFVALRAGSRHVETVYALPSLPESRPRLRERGVVLVTGGTGGLGLLFAGVLHDLCRARLVLTARWAPPPEGDWPERARRDDRIGRALAGVLALRERGADVAIVTADVARREDVAAAIEATRARYGAIHGVVHAAGELRPTPVVHKTREDAARVFGAKVLGAFHLEALLADAPLDICVQLSSMASQFPEAGQVDYAAANAVLDVLAANRADRHRGLSCATGWGPWQDVGMAVDRLRTTIAADAARVAARVAEASTTGAESIDHAVLRSRTRGPDGEVVYRGVLQRGHWLVDDHRLDGRRLLSGTTTVQLVHSAYVDHAAGPGAVELTGVAFQRPLYTEDDGTEIEIRFEPTREGERFVMRSRPIAAGGEWEENSNGYAHRREIAPGPLPPGPPESDWRAVPRHPRFGGRHITGDGRWSLARRELERDGRIWCRISLAPEFAVDLVEFPLHPAVLDVAGMIGSRGVAGEAVPHTYDCVRVHAPLPVESVLLASFRSTGAASVADFVFADLEGRVAVEIEGYVMKPYEGSSLDQDVSRRPSTTDRGENARRIVVTEPGDLDSIRIEPFAPRAPGRDEVQIEIHAAALNFRDVLTALGEMGPVPGGRLVPGGECSGVVRAVGPGVRRVAIGDAVVAIAPSTLATHTTLAEHSVAAMPSNLSFEHAAGLPIVFLTAVHALENLARLSRGERVLIHAGAGGVGLAAIQIAQAIGAEIHATAGSPDKRDYLRTLGVARVYDSRSLAFADEVRAATGGGGVDVVLNSLAGEFLRASLALLRPQGRFVEIGKRDLLADTPLRLAPFLRNLTFSAFDLGQIVEAHDPMLPPMFDALMDRFARGELKPTPTETMPLDRAADGFRRMARAQHVGKIVYAVRAAADAGDELARAFEQSYGTGVPVDWGLDVFRRLLCWNEAPTYLLAMGVAAEGLGKVALRPRVAAMDGRGRERLRTEYRAPRGAVEEALVRLWEKTLGVSPIGVDDDFLDLGGDSIEAIQLQHAIHREFDLRIKNTEFLAGPTIAALAALIAARSGQAARADTEVSA